MSGEFDPSELDRRIPVELHDCDAIDALPVVLKFSLSPDPMFIDRLHEIAVAWARLGLYGGFGGTLHEFPGGPGTGLSEEPEFSIGGDSDGFEVRMVLDFGSAPFASIDFLLRALRTYALRFDVPIARIVVGEVLDP